jgi:hypothetical protein
VSAVKSHNWFSQQNFFRFNIAVFRSSFLIIAACCPTLKKFVYLFALVSRERFTISKDHHPSLYDIAQNFQQSELSADVRFKAKQLSISEIIKVLFNFFINMKLL